MTNKSQITKEEFLKRLDCFVQYANRQPAWMKGRPENRRETEGKGTIKIESSTPEK